MAELFTPVTPEYLQQFSSIGEVELAYEKLVHLDSDGDIPVKDFVVQSIALGAVGRDIRQKLDYTAAGSFRKSLPEAISSPEFVAAYERGFFEPIVDTYGTQGQYRVRQMIVDGTGKNISDPVFSFRLTRAANTQVFSGSTRAEWNAIEEDMQAIGLDKDSKSIVALFKIAGMAYGNLRERLKHIHDSNITVLSKDTAQYWLRQLTYQDDAKARSIGYTLGYIDRLMSEARGIIVKKHPDIDADEAMQLWSVVNYCRYGDVSDEGKDFRKKTYTLLAEGNIAGAREVLFQAAVAEPNAIFNNRHYRYLHTTDEEILDIQHQLAVKKQEEQSAAYKEARMKVEQERMEKILEAREQKTQQSNPDLVEEANTYIGSYFWMEQKQDDGLEFLTRERRLIEITGTGTIVDKSVYFDPNLNEFVPIDVPYPSIRYKIHFIDIATNKPVENKSTGSSWIPGQFLEILEGENPDCTLTAVLDSELPVF